MARRKYTLGELLAQMDLAASYASEVWPHVEPVGQEFGARRRESDQMIDYNAEFREQVRESLDDPRPNLPHTKAQREMSEKKMALRKRLARRP
jgi:hypothetical protein